MDRDKALDVALSQIEKQFGKGAVMKMGDDQRQQVAAIPTGALSLDVALGIGGLPRGRVVEIYGPESSGKCLVAGTHVWTDHGLETIEELFARCGHATRCASQVTDVREQGIRLVNEDAELEGLAAITHNDRRLVWEVELASGRRVTATANHPLRTLDRHGCIVWRTVGELAAGDVLVSALFGAEEAASGPAMSEDEAALFGYVVARRDSRAGRAAPLAPPAQDDCAALLRHVLGADAVAGPDLGAWLDDAGLRGRMTNEELGTDPAVAAVPTAVRTGGAKAQRAFLAALSEAAATVEPSGSVSLTIASARLAEQVQLLLYGLGVPAHLRSRSVDATSDARHTLRVEPDAAGRFLDAVGFRSSRRMHEARTRLRHALASADGLAREDGSLSPDAAVSADGLAGPDALLTSPPLAFERVTAVTFAGWQPTFDVVLPRTHSFVANGVLSHNTTVALHVIAEAQKQGGIAAFVDAEHALDPTYAAALGVDVEELLVSQPDTGEQALEIADMLIRSGAIDVIVIDSVAALTPRAEIEGEMGDSHVGLQARLMSQALRKLAGSLNRSRTCAVFINQLREKIGVMFGSPETTPGGRALKFYSSVRLDVRRIESLKDGTNAVGNRVRVKVVKNKVAPPFRQAEFDIMYGEGISREGALLDVGVDGGIIRKAGAWYTYEGEQLGQGRENARTFLREHDDIALEIEKKAKDVLGISPVAESEPTPEDD